MKLRVWHTTVVEYLLINIIVSSSFLILNCCSLQNKHHPTYRNTGGNRHKNNVKKQKFEPVTAGTSRRQLLHLPTLLDSAVDMETIKDVAKRLALPIGGYAAFRIGAALSVIGQPRLPKLKSMNDNEESIQQKIDQNSIIGSKVVRLDDDNCDSATTTGARVRIFYPIQHKDRSTMNEKIAPYCTDGRETSDGMAGLVGFRQLGISFLLAHLADASSGCLDGSYIDNELVVTGGSDDASTKDNLLPLLVYSHGYGGNMDMATYFMRTMASKGMIVAAIEHTDGTASSTVLSDGSRLPFSPSLMSSRESLNRRADEIVQTAEYMHRNYPGVLSGNTFYGGHSYGCPSAILASSKRETATKQHHVLDGLILHDPALGMGYSLLPKSVNVPTLSYTSDEYNRGGVKYGDLTLHVKGAFHGNFVDAPLWAPSWVMRPLSTVIPASGPADPELVHEELAKSAIAFMESKSVNVDGVIGSNTNYGDSAGAEKASNNDENNSIFERI